MVSWDDTNQYTLIVNDWESVMILMICIFKYFCNVLESLSGSEHYWISGHEVIGFESFAAFSDTVVGKNWHLFGSYESLICTSSELISNCVSTKSTPKHWQKHFPILENL